MEGRPRYTAKEIEDGLYSGMDPDVELVAAQYYDALRAELSRLKAESLRVVVDGDAVPVSELSSRQLFTCNHPGVWIIFDCDSWVFRVRDIIANTETALTEAAIVQPVRLERWEDE